LLKNLIKLLISLSLASSVYAETTNNLVSQDFSTGWTNTGNTYHGNLTIAGVHNGTVESDTVSLNSVDINKESLNEGFTVTGGADIWFWNSYSQSVTQTIKAVDDNGNIITQTRVINGIENGYQTYTDQLIVNSNTQQDYDVNLKYSFSVPGTSSHYGADLKNPSLTVSYTYVPPLDQTTQNELFAMNESINEDLSILNFYDAEILTEEFKFQEEKIEEFTYTPMEMFEEEPKLETPTTAFQEMALYTETMKEEPTEEMKEIFSEIVEESPEEKASEDSSSLQAEPLSSEEQDKEKQTLPQKQQTKQVANDNKNTSSGGVKLISLNKVMDKIDAKVKEIDKNLQLKNLVKINAMASNNILKDYNVPFYKQRKIYTDQPNIVDNRVIYANNLSTYIQNDPIAKREDYLYRINLEKQKLLNELEVLKNG